MRRPASILVITCAALAVALVGFAGAANASATVDLIWIDRTDPTCTNDGRRDCPQLGATISSVAVTDNITLAVILTAGPNGSFGAVVSVNYGDALPSLSVVGFQSLTTTVPFVYLPWTMGTPINHSPYIDSITSVAAPPFGLGIGLSPGQSAYLGTVSFHKDLVVNGIFEIAVGTDGPSGTNGVLDGFGNDITSTTTFNSAYLVSRAVVLIDIKPGSDSNPINPSSKGNLPVAILGSDTFDVMNVDVTTLAFGPDATAPSHDLTATDVIEGHLQDVNGDGFTDLVSHYRTQETGITPDEARACIAGETLDGASFAGCDAIKAAPRT